MILGVNSLNLECMDIIFEISDLKIKCKTLDNKTSQKLLKLMPIKSKIATWGDEIYFDTPNNDIAAENDAKEVFNLGEIAFWNQGSAIAIGFGKTPVSKKDEIRLISKANHWANAYNPEDLKKLKAFKDGEPIKVSILDK